MSAPQLTDASTSSEWIRTVAETAATDKRRNPSQTSIPDAVPAGHRKRFVRLVTYTMVGLVGFTLLGVASFAWRQRALQRALTAPAPVTFQAPATASPAALPPAPETPPAAASAAPATVASSPPKAATKAGKKTVKRSPFLSTKPATKTPKR